jgi:hypothetical protein
VGARLTAMKMGDELQRRRRLYAQVGGTRRPAVVMYLTEC